ncbi:hypothetical protein LTR78_005281 [Recurvomyces mirabilis]|uniref:Spc7 kinetochore protein domain-containing protein n=1 Tax=Recurvomyces mirabilis TaxID=574656 RepID=A0AAE1C1P0_9PEZI|nr:hypothetical protein LTR78_005281 [Recurvomyces mirabilis]KAK5157831.1 hypothetical protein LTS14_003753 [Recurvomyces mirabilis]
MAAVDDKENVAPFTSSDPLARKGSSPAKKLNRKGRSKSIGPGDSVETPSESAKHDARNRRKSAFVPASKAIISSEAEKKARQAARRQTLANRRVSFAPEATLHTWDVIEFMRDQTTSTDSSDQTRRASNITRAGSGSSPVKRPARAVEDGEPPSTPPEQEDEPKTLPASPAPQRDLHRKQTHRSSAGISPAEMINPEDMYSSGMSGSSDVSGSEEEDEEEEEEGEEDDLEDATGTAMSLDEGEETIRSSESGSSTSSSLTRRLKEASEMAGTRGIEYDEYGEGTVSMELASEEVTNAFKPWAQRQAAEPVLSASLDQENVNPFSPAFKAQIVSGVVTRPATIEEEDTADMSMDVTRAVGGILKQAQAHAARESSPMDDGTMDMTQAVGKIYATAGQKRRRSTTEAGSPGENAPATVLKRSRRSSAARSSMGDDTMDLTVAIGGIKEPNSSPFKPQRRRSAAATAAARRRSSGVQSEQEEATMDFTVAVGGIKAAQRAENTASSFDENEELTMELTTVLGGFKTAQRAAAANQASPTTPKKPMSPAKNLSPKDQERYKDAPDSGPKKLLTPIFQKQVHLSAEKPLSSAEKSAQAAKRRRTISPGMVSWMGAVFDETREPENDAAAQFAPLAEEDRHDSPAGEEVAYPELSAEEEPVEETPLQESVVEDPPIQETRVEQVPLQGPIAKMPSARTTPRTPPSQSRVFQLQLDAQLLPMQPSPSVEKVLRSTPAKQASTPEVPRQTESQEARNTLASSIRLMSTPRKETLKALTPKKQPVSKQASPVKAITPRPRLASARKSPATQVRDDILATQPHDEIIEHVHLGDFLEQAGIRFMDITATKRRMTIAPTPSKLRRSNDMDENEPAESNLTMETALISAACTQPEHDMYQHACHELKHYIDSGKKVIKTLEAETYEDTPPLIQAWMNAEPSRRAILDVKMRDMKTQARLRSKEMWYQWRSQLLGDLVKGLSGIGEGLLRDDEVLTESETVLDAVLPGLVEQKESMELEAERLEQALSATSEEGKMELEAARARLLEVDAELEEKREILAMLQKEGQEQESVATDLQDSKTEFLAAIQEAERVRESCRGVSHGEISALKDSITNLETTHGWKITSASSSPPTVTMTYRSSLQLFFHPAAFLVPTQSTTTARPNAPISLSYVAQDRHGQVKDLDTTQRFFLQFLRASLQALPQCETRVAELLGFVSQGWTTAQAVVQAEERLNIVTLTSSRIVSDEKLAMESDLLFPAIRTKVRVAFELAASVGQEADLRLVLGTGVDVRVVYGEEWNEGKMTKFVGESVGVEDVGEGWADAVRELRGRLGAGGGKGFRK